MVISVIRINQIKLNLADDEKLLRSKAASALKIKENQITELKIVKKSIDARQKPLIRYVYSIEVSVENEKLINKKLFGANIVHVEGVSYKIPKHGNIPLKERPVIVGMGPAGLFCGYYLAKEGYEPVLIERGENVDDRKDTVEKFWNGGPLNTESNVQFGEGGAGTFSDGKLNTLVKDKNGRNREVLETFVKFGANPDILYKNKPHIGTDVLCGIVKNMRNEIVRLGGTVRFGCKLTDIVTDGNEIRKIIVNGSEEIPCSVLVMAVGHSARDTFEMLKGRIVMEPKAFAVGVRIEHPQSMINEAMYGQSEHELLEAADYKVTHNTEEGRGVYSFCMCPGGYVVNASSEEGRLALNGMSYSGRDGKNANSAVIVTVTPDDYGRGDVLDGIRFQRELEEKAYVEGNGNIPIQCFGDFEKNIPSKNPGEIKPWVKGGYSMGNLRNIFPEYISETIVEGIHSFGNQIHGFDRDDAVLLGVESRTSSPVRIVRNEKFMSSVLGVYPCGEGAGYAGGITSAAMDGLRIFEAVASKYSPLRKR